jgi:uncharacterized protein (TIGR02231 family)
MKLKFAAILALVFMHAILLGQELKMNNKITDVTVYRGMAKETRAGVITIPAGTTDVFLPGATMELNDQSVQVAAKGEAVLLAAGVRVNYHTEDNPMTKDNKAEKLNDSILVYNKKLRWIGEERSVYDGELKLVMDLMKPSPGKENYKPEELNLMADIYRKRFMDLKQRLFDLSLQQEGYEIKRNNCQNVLNEMGNTRINPTKEIVLSFFAEKETTVNIKVMYLVNRATWTPIYDVNVESTSQPVNLSYKASIVQNTGSDWKDVKLAVSTATPSFNNNRPIMQPKYLDYVNYRITENFYSNTATNMMQVDKIAVESINAEPLSSNIVESDLMVEFVLENRQNIPSDNKAHVCKLTSYSIPATYRYHVVPKLDPTAFLMARITDYGQYNLLNGEANVFYGDLYVGQVQLNPQTTSDTLLLSLGRDEKIVVKRCRIENKTGKKSLSGVDREEFEYEIKVRNNKKVPIEIEVLDQIPLSRRKEIEVKLESYEGADYQKEYGKLLWNLRINPNSDKIVRFSYRADYPSGKVVGEQ